MKVWEEKHKLVMPKSHGRSKGLHISEVIRDLAFAGNVLDEKWRNELAIELQDTSLMQVGMAWEDYLEKSNQHPEIEYHPCEMRERTGICAICGDDDVDHALGSYDHDYVELLIYMSPDGFTWEDGAVLMFLNEIKFTKKSCRDFAQGLRMGSKKSLMYVWQILAYLKGAGCLAAKLHVMFVNGNYSFKMDDPESGSVYRIFRLLFEQEEVDRNWTMLMAHAREMIREKRWSYAA